MATDYNTIASDYLKTKVNPIKKYSEEYTFFLHLGDVKGKSVLDLACGDGYYTRLLRLAGAKPIIGVDISSGMIDLAQTLETQQPLDIEYRVGDAATLGVIGVFDVVTAVYLFQYASDETTFQQMAATIGANLKENGRFLAVTGSPTITQAHLDAQAHYGALIEPQGPLQDGTPIRNTFTTPGGVVQFTNHHWTQPTYEQVLKQVGFHTICWHSMQVSAQGITQFPDGYWQPYLEHPAITILECYK